jgi:CRISPR-associated protein Cas5d
MLKKGGRRDIFLGARECQGYVEPCRVTDKESFYDKQDNFSFGLMFHGFDYPGEQEKNMLTARFWNASMENGIIRFPRPEACSMRRNIRPMKPLKIAVNTQEVIE